MALFNLGRYADLPDPFSGVDRLQDEVDKLFGLINQGGYRGLYDRSFSPDVDVVESSEDVRILCNVPGLDKKDLDISLANNVLTLKGERRIPEEKGKVFKSELWAGSFQRTLSLPPTIDPEQVTADLADGLLRIRIAKRPETKPRQITVAVK